MLKQCPTRRVQTLISENSATHTSLQFKSFFIITLSIYYMCAWQQKYGSKSMVKVRAGYGYSKGIMVIMKGANILVSHDLILDF